MPSAGFVHLHNHTMYSLLDGAVKIEDMAQRASDLGMPAIAITDHGNMFGAVEFYKKVKEKGIKPIIGCEVYVAIEGMNSRREVMGIKDGANHLVLLAKNNKGYKNLMKIVSAAYLEGFYYHPRVDKEILKEYSEGLICLSACLKGELPYLISMNRPEKAKEAASKYLEIFGEGNYYIELQRHGIKEQGEANPVLIEISKELGIPLVATNDAHYLQQDHTSMHDVLICIQTGKTIEDEKRMKFITDQVYLKSPEEMHNLFSDVPEAVENTVQIAEKCDVEIELGRLHLPAYPLPQGYDFPEKYLEDLAREGLQKRYDEIMPEVEERFNFEMDIIKKTDYAGYFLIVADYVRYALENGIRVGYGRGSGAASIVAYALGITGIDPIKYDLIFERFLNLERIEMPDFDIDFSDKDRIISYVTGKYGSDSVCQVITFGTMAAKGVVRDVGRAMGIPYSEVDRIAKLIPNELGITLEGALKSVPELKAMEKSDGPQAELIHYAKFLEGLARHASVHAAAVIIVPGKLTDYVPLYKSPKGDKITTQYDMDICKDLGLLKMDFLGLKELSLQDNVVKMVSEYTPDFNIEKIPLDDKKTYELFGRGDTWGVFQFESQGMRESLRKLKPDNIEDLIAMNALYRPGPMAYIPDYIARKHGVSIEYDHPLLEPVLKDTYGVIVYQEQVLRIARDLAGFTLGEADILRAAMSKKKMEIMEKQKGKFFEGCEKKGVEPKIAEKIYNDIAVFSGYAFNRAHAACYAVMAYQNGYLKANYPKEFMAGSLTNDMSDSDKMALMIEECKRIGIELLPPDINESQADFTVTEEGVRFGLAALKNVGRGAADAISQAIKRVGKFETIFDFCETVDLRTVNRRAIESLICAGATDSIEGHRAQLIQTLNTAIESAQFAQDQRVKGQISLFDDNQITSGRTGKRTLPPVEEWTETQMLEKEKEVLGFFMSGHPLKKYEDQLNALIAHPSDTLPQLSKGAPVKIGGIITDVRRNTDKKGAQMAFITLEDLKGAVDVVAFSETYGKYSSLIEPDKLVIIKGRMSANGNKSVQAEEFVVLDEALKGNVKAVNLSIPFELVERGKLMELRKLCEMYSGECDILIHLEDEGNSKSVIRSRTVTVSPSSDLISALKSRLGEDRVWMK